MVDASRALIRYLFIKVFKASRVDQLPEEINLCVAVDRQVKMNVSIQSLSMSVQRLSSDGSAHTVEVVHQLVTAIDDGASSG